MAETADTAVLMALLERLGALTFSPAIEVAYPNVPFTQPVATRNAMWLRATFLPAPKTALGIDPRSANEISGIFQVDVIAGAGAGEPWISRVAQAVMAWFARGTDLVKDSQRVRVNLTPYRGRMMKDDTWMIIPVSIPYQAFTTNPA